MKAIIAAVSIVTVLAVYLTSRSTGTPNRTPESVSGGLLSSLPEGKASLDTGVGYPLPSADNAYFFLKISPDRRSVRFDTKELNPATSEWEEWSTAHPVSYEILGFACVTSHAFYVLGRDDVSQNEIVEYWSIRPAAGAYQCTRSLSLNAQLGDPISTPDAVESIVGGTFISPYLRIQSLPVRRMIYNGAGLGGIQGAQADPDGRYVLLTTPAGLFRLWRVGGLFSLVLTSSDIPYLGIADALGAFRHPTLGRVYLMRTPARLDPGGVAALLLYDFENDGILDSSEVLDAAGWDISDVIGECDDDFLNY
jgi:hypothetical protein